VLTARAAAAAVQELADLPLTKVEDEVLLDRAWALRQRVRISDAFYVACAQLLEAPLVTADARLARAGLTGVTIHLVA
jgi:predicted nucleic acid-binding protein